MTVLELARKSDVGDHVIRYYARIGLLHPTYHSRNGYKIFAGSDVARVRFVRQAQSLGYTLKEIAQIFEESLRGKSPCPRVREIIKRRIKENRDKLAALVQLQTRMEQALAQWSKMSDGVPDGTMVCHLIESVAKRCEEVKKRLDM
jgi:DNA-binding transcriptional MerR regulator